MDAYLMHARQGAVDIQHVRGCAKATGEEASSSCSKGLNRTLGDEVARYCPWEDGVNQSFLLLLLHHERFLALLCQNLNELLVDEGLPVGSLCKTACDHDYYANHCKEQNREKKLNGKHWIAFVSFLWAELSMQLRCRLEDKKESQHEEEGEREQRTVRVSRSRLTLFILG